MRTLLGILHTHCLKTVFIYGYYYRYNYISGLNSIALFARPLHSTDLHYFNHALISGITVLHAVTLTCDPATFTSTAKLVRWVLLHCTTVLFSLCDTVTLVTPSVDQPPLPILKTQHNECKLVNAWALLSEPEWVHFENMKLQLFFPGSYYG